MTTIRKWLAEQEAIGHSTFSLSDVQSAFPNLSAQVIQNNLRRLKLEQRIASVYRRFYVSVPVKYKARGIVPPSYYIADLMRYLNRPYYFGLLTAARIWGASHQASTLDFVMTCYPSLRVSSRTNGEIRWCYRYSMPQNFLIERKDENGRVFYSSPELTAVELVQYEQHCGGLSRVATILSELAETLNFTKLQREFFAYCKGSDIQRLGYLFDEVLGEKKLADDVYNQWRANFASSWTLLKPQAKDSPVISRNHRWRLVINAEMEVDDL